MGIHNAAFLKNVTVLLFYAIRQNDQEMYKTMKAKCLLDSSLTHKTTGIGGSMEMVCLREGLVWCKCGTWEKGWV